MKLLPLLLASSSVAFGAAPSDSTRVFHELVAPILVKNCVECHNDVTTKGGLNLATLATTLQGGESGPALIPGQASNSRLFQAIVPAAAGATPDMPKKKAPLTSAETALIRAWIDNGAAWPAEIVLKEKPKGDLSHWAFLPLQQTPDKNSIDDFITTKLRHQGLTMNPPADARTFIRRASFDLTGLPPTPEEVHAFEAELAPPEKREVAYTRLIERLLDSPRYGERWARHWLDVVRFAESHGFEMNRARPNAWPYRDYVIEAFNSDKPYDQFVREQIAGDQLQAPRATGFLVAGAWDQVKGADPVLRANQRADEMHDIVSTTGSTFMGLTVGCARCHDHKFDPISQVDYFHLRAIFEGVQHGERELPPADAEQRLAKAASIKKQISKLDAELARFQPRAQLSSRVLVDDSLPAPTQKQPRGCIQIEQPANGKPINYTPGTKIGQASDPGDATHLPNLGESYRYWKALKDEPARDFFAWRPAVSGKHHIWLSWGAWTTHTKDAHYILDEDGDANTKADQKEIAVVDQSQFADGKGAIPEQKCWSGFRYAGTHLLKRESIVILRSGKLGGPTVADTLLVEAASSNKPSAQPHLRPPVTHQANHESFDPLPARFVRMSISSTIGAEPCIDELEVISTHSQQNIALASLGAKATASSVLGDGNNRIHQIAHINDGKYGNAWSWISKQSGQGWVQLELPKVENINQITWSRDRGNAKLERVYQDRLPSEYIFEISLDGKTWKPVASSADRLGVDYREKIRDLLTLSDVSSSNAEAVHRLGSQRADLQRELTELTTFPKAYLGKFEQPGPTHRLHRGDPMMPKEEITPGALSQFGRLLELSKNAPEAERRLSFAAWLTAPENPLLARVMVNRLWHYHFGTGLVETPSDFGFNGGKPSHPELLDWLALQFIHSGWSVKHIHRLIMQSNTYRQSNAAHERGMQADSGTRLLWRFPPRRLEAEALRDTLLQISGVLDLTMGGPGFDLFEPNENYVKVYQSKEQFGPETFRRMVYQSKPRVQLDDTFGAFDLPDAGQIAPRRTSSTTPLQALNFLNSGFAMQQADLFAKRLVREAGSQRPPQVQRAFQLAYGRAPNPTELSESTRLITQHGLPMFCRALFNTSEFMTLY